MLLKGPGTYGYPTDLWTLKRIAEVIEKQFGVSYDPSGVWHVLQSLGWVVKSQNAEFANATKRLSFPGIERTGRAQDNARRRVQIEWLPPYAPDLNPDEQIWTQTKYGDLANFIPEDVTDIRQAVQDSLQRTRTQQSFLRSFFKHAELKL